jgi:hypothetical protein
MMPSPQDAEAGDADPGITARASDRNRSRERKCPRMVVVD